MAGAEEALGSARAPPGVGLTTRAEREFLGGLSVPLGAEESELGTVGPWAGQSPNLPCDRGQGGPAPSAAGLGRTSARRRRPGEGSRAPCGSPSPPPLLQNHIPVRGLDPSGHTRFLIDFCLENKTEGRTWLE